MWKSSASTWQEARHVDEGHQRDIEGVAKADEAGALQRTERGQSAAASHSIRDLFVERGG